MQKISTSNFQENGNKTNNNDTENKDKKSFKRS